MATTQPRGGQILDQSIKLDTPNQDVTGTLPVANGGTGNATNTLNSLLVGNGTGALLGLAPSSTGQVAVSNGTAWASSSSGVVLTSPKVDSLLYTDGSSVLSHLGVSGGTATPTLLNLGSNYGTGTPGTSANLKVKIYDSGGADSYGIGISGGMLEVASGSAISLYINGGTRALVIDSSGTYLPNGVGTGASAVVTTTDTQPLQSKTLDNTNTINTWACAPNVLSTSQTITANSGAYIPDLLEISAGIQCEIGAGSVLEIG